MIMDVGCADNTETSLLPPRRREIQYNLPLFSVDCTVAPLGRKSSYRPSFLCIRITSDCRCTGKKLQYRSWSFFGGGVGVKLSSKSPSFCLAAEDHDIPSAVILFSNHMLVISSNEPIDKVALALHVIGSLTFDLGFR